MTYFGLLGAKYPISKDPKTIPLMRVGIRVLQHSVLEPFGPVAVENLQGQALLTNPSSGCFEGPRVVTRHAPQAPKVAEHGVSGFYTRNCNAVPFDA